MKLPIFLLFICMIYLLFHVAQQAKLKYINSPVHAKIAEYTCLFGIVFLVNWLIQFNEPLYLILDIILLSVLIRTFLQFEKKAATYRERYLQARMNQLAKHLSRNCYLHDN